MLARVEYTVKGELTDSDIQELKIMQELEDIMLRNEGDKREKEQEQNEKMIAVYKDTNEAYDRKLQQR